MKTIDKDGEMETGKSNKAIDFLLGALKGGPVDGAAIKAAARAAGISQLSLRCARQTLRIHPSSSWARYIERSGA